MPKFRHISLLNYNFQTSELHFLKLDQLITFFVFYWLAFSRLAVMCVFQDENEDVGSGPKFDILSTMRMYIKIISCWVAIWGLGYYRISPSWVALGAIGYMAYLRAYEKRKLMDLVMKGISEDEKTSIINSIRSHELPTWVCYFHL